MEKCQLSKSRRAEAPATLTFRRPCVQCSYSKPVFAFST